MFLLYLLYQLLLCIKCSSQNCLLLTLNRSCRFEYLTFVTSFLLSFSSICPFRSLWSNEPTRDSYWDPVWAESTGGRFLLTSLAPRTFDHIGSIRLMALVVLKNQDKFRKDNVKLSDWPTAQSLPSLQSIHAKVSDVTYAAETCNAILRKPHQCNFFSANLFWYIKITHIYRSLRLSRNLSTSFWTQTVGVMFFATLSAQDICSSRDQ